jgi:ribonucleoside-diphosphate reductase alpha chain
MAASRGERTGRAQRSRNATAAATGLSVSRVFTTAGADPFGAIEWTTRTSRITNPDGSVVFEMKDAEIPAAWSQVATDIMVSKYFRKAGVPQVDAQGNPLLDGAGQPVLGPERSAKQVIHRLAGTWRWWGENNGYFATADDAQAFEDELKFMLATQVAAPNSPQWFNTGLAHAYGITGPAQGHYYVDPTQPESVRKSGDAYTRPQPHACFIQNVEDDLVNDNGIMDLWVREARLFKYGSGTGTNFSKIRGEGEPLAGGGSSSGLMSFLKVGDRAAGAIKSGGTTRRAAKMVVLDADHPDVETFVDWKPREELKVAAMVEGMKHLTPEQQERAQALGLELTYDYNGEAYSTVSGQNSNNSVRLTNDFIEAVRDDREWNLIRRTDGEVYRTIRARDLWTRIAVAAWQSADPGVQFDTTINEWHTSPEGGRINASNPCSEYMFLDNTACNLASLNLIKFIDVQSGAFHIDAFRHAVRLWTVVLEISVLMAQFPSKEIARLSYDYRTLGLGYANIGTVLMILGMPYDSEAARAYTGVVTALMTGESYAASAELASVLGPFPEYGKNAPHMLRVIRNHRRAAYDAPESEYEALSVLPMPIDQAQAPADLLQAAQNAWDTALERGEKDGYRNAQTTLLAPTGTIGLLMDCDTTGVEPDFALVKFKKLAGGGYFKIANQSIAPALKNLGYSDAERKDILTYVLGTLSLDGASHINRASLTAKGLNAEDISKIEAALPGVFELGFAFNAWSLGEAGIQRLGLTMEQASTPGFELLRAIGFTRAQIDEANEVICGSMTIEGAPHLRPEHEAVFDTANKSGKKGTRYIKHMGHITMMAAAQSFLSGAISKTINMPNEATVEDVEDAYYASWKHGVKAMALYRDGSKMSQPLSNKSDTVVVDEESVKAVVEDAVSAAVAAKDAEIAALQAQIAKLEAEKVAAATPSQVPAIAAAFTGQGQLPGMPTVPTRRRLPSKRHGFTQEARVAGHKVYLRTGEYEDGTIGEIFIDMHKEGAAFRSMINSFAIAVSKGLQYGVPLQEFVDTFTFVRFEPQGMVAGHPNIKLATSVIDFVFRVLGLEYLGRTDLVQVSEDAPKPIDQTGEDRDLLPSEDDIMQGVGPSPAQRIASPDAPAVPTIVPAVTTVAKNGSANGNGNGHGHHHAEPSIADLHVEAAAPVATSQATTASVPLAQPRSAVDQQLGEMMGDAPFCDVCGHITVRNGACYKCLNCGNSLGCS